MKYIALLLLFLGITKGFAQVFIVDNTYILENNVLNKTPREVDVLAIDSFLETLKVPIEMLEQKVQGHLFVNIIIKNKKITETSLMYGINSLVDNQLVKALKNVKLNWLGIDVSENCKFVVGMRVDYHNCTLQHIANPNLTEFSYQSDDSIQFTKFISTYNTFSSSYSFENIDANYYSKGISTKQYLNALEQLKTTTWITPQMFKNAIVIDYDKSQQPKVLMQTEDSIFFFKEGKLIFGEYGDLKSIKQSGETTVLEIESACSSCNKLNRTINIYKSSGKSYEFAYSISSYNPNPSLPFILPTKNFVRIVTEAFIRTLPYKNDGPYNSCTGYSSDEKSCIFSKTWGNIFGVMKRGYRADVLQTYTDSYKEKWYFVCINHQNQFYVGWVNQDDVQEIANKK